MSLSKKYKFIIFSDTHLPVEGKEEKFSDFLSLLEECSTKTETIVLLGDIFEVWSGVSYYNHQRGQKLLKKITDIRPQSKVFLVEGNWDFFLCKNFKEKFDTCTEKHLKIKTKEKNFVFTHGHYFGDIQTRILNFILTNPISYFVWKTELLKNLEIKVAKKFLNKETNPLPDNYDLSKAAQNLKNKFGEKSTIICGHFHKEERHQNVFFLEDYCSSEKFYGLTENALESLVFLNGEIKTLQTFSL